MSFRAILYKFFEKFYFLKVINPFGKQGLANSEGSALFAEEFIVEQRVKDYTGT